METTQESVNEHSEEENEMNLLNTSKVRKKAKILHSDLENEEKGGPEPESHVESSGEDEISDLNSEISRTKKRIAIVDSDSEDDDIHQRNVQNKENDDETVKDTDDTEGKEIAPDEDTRTKKRLAIVDSDSDDDDMHQRNVVQNKENNDETVKDTDDIEDVDEEEEIAPHNKSFPDEDTALEAVIYTTNSKSELVAENNSINIKKPSLSALCDSESSEEETDRDIIEATMVEDYKVQPKVYKRAPRKNKEERPKGMSVQEAAKQKTEIQAESQRMLRESNVSLPYHKPKSYTIKEFLQKRAKLASLPSLPKAPPSIAMKMSKDQLKEVSKKLDERIKEVEEFYKSESDEDEEKDDPSEEIKGWLNFLVDSAVDADEEKINELIEEPSEEVNKSESMEYEFNLEDVNENESKKNISELIKERLNIQPKLSGTPDDIIDLDAGVTRPNEVKRLVEKFFQHTLKRAPHKHKVKLDVVGVGAGGEIIKETVSMNVDEEEEPALVEIPGAKLHKLREELQVQMAQKRLELWKQKQEQGDCLTTERKDGYEEGCTEKDILDDDEEEEFEMSESESEEEEEDEEEEEEDLVQPEKSQIKSAFLDDEADEDEEEPEDDEEDNENDADIDEVVDNEELTSPKKRILRRILKPFAQDSDEEEEQQSQETESSKVVKYYTTNDDDFIPPNLPRVGKTPQRTQLDKSKSEFEFLTPVTYLTGLQNLNSDSKQLPKDSPTSPLCASSNPSPSNEIDSQTHLHKNLFPENSDLSQSSQDNMDDLAQLCSGTFPETQKLPEEVPPTTQDLLNLCSGDFSTVATAKVDQTSEKVVIQTGPEPEIKNLDEEHDQIISQLLDEDELERFTKKFESPINTFRKSQIPEDAQEANASGLINSDDENEGLELTMKKRKKLVFSDDEDGDDQLEDADDQLEEEEDEQIDLHDDDDEQQLHLQDDDDDEEQQLENEVVAQESSNFKLADFLDAEAELSESEWGSADEDEKGLDELEVEQGDEDTFNEKEVRSELERIHMRQILDEDNREVKLLQELLLENGELHGTGRKRQFRWKALDSANSGEFEKRDDDDIFLDEEESEEQWRKMRHKREMFLKKKPTEEEDDSILGDSQILKVGQQIFKNKLFNSQTNTPVNKSPDDCKEPFNLLNKRGSFLSRKDQVLQRLAEYNKVSATVGSTAKNSKCFVFQTVEAETVVKDNNNKRKATESTPNVIKKLRLEDLSPAVGKKNSGKSSRAKKLFGNW